ncbi:MAG: pilin glycosylation protein [Zetaproteobacteria bacterium CG12_big_fil_rev_8_21_14_0_65_55_1124]|nr:MAG: pilin glycosylation protein [Zetaproteobacteria bacterium CG1_02_55_237]PIS18327.1 MAG: pilin glycosylation protein [Zetaproteobacteria bacterium CG08_land_8_20_14_0_20_55_17]PIW43080.1 MAG: pilin glycosylation protein [Zetaproteobacteria bacterium CG12_big_fil_rev_8_21_14_0_65_55_1124]PIY52267.1 MAG: pilin glycosylation protein [Zetaproteobacteria bacterium CG_4_10_14_0_8_um_filter_55_43]PIZ38758.1 MAG: pilin glycosylation protein [Zetaproteobacteria bacterium CG_4_10_14_0_2_um_filter_
MSSLLIIGASGHGKVVAETAEAIGSWETIAFLDDDFATLNGKLRWPVVASSKDAITLSRQYDAVVVAIGHAEIRLRFINELAAAGCVLPVLLHPAAWVSMSANLGVGSVVFAGAVIQADVRLGRAVIVNTSASVDHDCQLADGVHVCPGAHLAGNIVVGEGAWLGIGCVVKQGVCLGKGVTVGAGAVVLKNVTDGLTVAGCPARAI